MLRKVDGSRQLDMCRLNEVTEQMAARGVLRWQVAAGGVSEKTAPS